MKKRNMSLILVLALILCLIPATAFAGTGATLSGNITEETVITEDTTISGTVTVAGLSGKIIVEDGVTLTIAENGVLDLTAATSESRVLQIEEGATLVVNGAIYSLNNFADVSQLGTMEVSGPKAKLVMDGKNTKQVYIGTNGLITLDETAVITSTPLTAGKYEDGYKYEISGGTASTHGFPNSGKDELVVASGATLDATGGLTLGGSSTKQLTVKKGGKLVTGGNTTLASLYGIESPAQDKITSGTYTEDPDIYVAEGYKAVKNDNDTWTVNPKKYLSKIAITIKEPKVGETPATTYKWTVQSENSGVPTGGSEPIVQWAKMEKYDESKDIGEQMEGNISIVGENEKFQKGYYYLLATTFNPNEGYELSENFGKSSVTVNGKNADYVNNNSKVVSIMKVFGPLTEEAKSPATADNNELGLFAVVGLLSVAAVALLLNRKRSM